jgi:hypothetical protein
MTPLDTDGNAHSAIRETAAYKPAVSGLEKLARYFGVSITAFFPAATPKSRINTILSATAGLDDADLDQSAAVRFVPEVSVPRKAHQAVNCPTEAARVEIMTIMN